MLFSYLVIKMNMEKIDWNKKVNGWINDLAEIEEFLDEARETYEIGEDLKIVLLERFKGIIDEFNSDFMEMWKQKEYEKIDKMYKLLNIVFDDLMKYAKI